MAASMAQLSELQRLFAEFCAVLQELVLNHQVAHSAVTVLHDDLPSLQPESSGRAACEGGRGAVSGSGQGRQAVKAAGGGAATDRLRQLAPRLTPCAASAAAPPADPAHLPAVECQDNYIVLQNATLKSRDLLARLGGLRQGALQALHREEERAQAGQGMESGEPNELDLGEGDPFDPALDADVVLTEPAPLLDPAGEGSGGELGATGTDVASEGTAAGHGAAAADAQLTPASPAPTRASAVPRTPAFSATSAAPAARAAPAPAAPSPPARLLGPELVLLMGQLLRGAGLEVEMLGRVANAVELSTSAEDLYAYGTMLKLQPYTDERALAAALAQRDLLLPPAKATAAGAGAGRR
ncbi:hypothetical protein HYH03_010935 [Edaphochlamys debaryana]|uniref:Uncharacterized protein n=1 Tax=Edaphochlamys debaryana TaxID=47281 RepID=A0A836BVE0_9CHLO|nr:hypothetical protein HYH03_010935 [Edaphochlamys debaryana]|eukprot:KAG2490541.1 hypothetical protein HYH03_010935 [Edaphochlamys debaryana]